jgi:hypothetical protein
MSCQFHSSAALSYVQKCQYQWTALVYLEAGMDWVWVVKSNICPCTESKPDSLVKPIASQYTGWFKRKFNTLGGNSKGHCEKKVHINMCLILNRYRDRAVGITRPNCVRLFVGLDEERSLQKKGGYARRIGRSHFGCCCAHKGTWRSTETNNTWSSHTSCKVHWGWGWNLRTFIVNCNKFVI